MSFFQFKHDIDLQIFLLTNVESIIINTYTLIGNRRKNTGGGFLRITGAVSRTNSIRIIPMNHQSRIFGKMITPIKDLLTPPVFEEEEKTRIARILGIILWSVVAVVGALISIWVVTGKSYELGPYAFLANGVIVAVAIGLLFLST
jgi:hypothetical protein